MPIYDSQCRNCRNRSELVVLKSTVVACPNCQSHDLEQLLSGDPVIDAFRVRIAAFAGLKHRISEGGRNQLFAHPPKWIETRIWLV